MNFTILVPNNSEKISENEMHEAVRTGLKGMVEEKNHEGGQVSIWVP